VRAALCRRNRDRHGPGRLGQVPQGLAVIDRALARSDKSEERWIIAELLRIKGELILLQDSPNAAVAAQDLFQKSLERARRQGARVLSMGEPGCYTGARPSPGLFPEGALP